jgi:hypothetical protein
MAAETDPKLIDGTIPGETDTTPDPTPTPGPAVPNGGPYQTQTEPQPAK